MKRDVVIHAFPRTNSVRVPHVRTSVRGATKTGRTPIKALSFSLFPYHQSRVPHISLVFCEMWDTTALPPKPLPSRFCWSHPSGGFRGRVFLLREPHAVRQPHES